MARYGVELLVVLVGTLLLVSVQGWERINETELLSLYQRGEWGQTQSVTATDDSSNSDAHEEIPEDAFPEFEGEATGDDWASFANHGFQVATGDSGPRNWASGNDGGYQEATGDSGPRNWASGSDGGYHVEFVDTPEINWDSRFGGETAMEFVDAPPRSWTSSSTPRSGGLDVVCSDDGFQVMLPNGLLSEVKVLGSKDMMSITEAPDSCGYEVNFFTNTLSVPFTGCNVKHTDSYSLQLLYVDDFGQTQVATVTCEESPKSGSGPFPRTSGPTKKCNNPTTPSKAQNCAVASGERVPCGQSGMSSADCEKMGCCVDPSQSTCYYPMDECTGDQHFVFAIRSDSASIPIDPTKLVLPASPNCKPVIVNDKVAIFKFKVTECGARAYTVGETKIYLAEVQTIVQALNLKYGAITRSDPLRFMVECRYGKTGGTPQSLASIGYMVKTPSSSLPSQVVSNGLYGVQLRLAKDSTYKSYLATNSQPLKLLLGNPVYLELRLKSPKPDAVIIVNYCIAYPRSANNALVLVYEGCANPYDPNVSILKVSNLPTNRYQRRFVVTAFQFMDQKTNKYLDEEIYFMCSSEVCRTTEKKCEERCFDGKAP
ncbi:zona pellucida sperm-binding protein 4-like isoform X2 [Notolabrus celidotus]|uniref:zona pellucida sperm-binding protein 4-like isoform X2 n=1 Tax=Notolabrus celidotus TaxID=1203425 RepID=UPI00148FE157|nr:zona pellucida sperm-binding protein 4-like isoform X2 [Notolabrus celidotus]